jgi:hypothetical protein
MTLWKGFTEAAVAVVVATATTAVATTVGGNADSNRRTAKLGVS